MSSALSSSDDTREPAKAQTVADQSTLTIMIVMVPIITTSLLTAHNSADTNNMLFTIEAQRPLGNQNLQNNPHIS